MPRVIGVRLWVGLQTMRRVLSAAAVSALKDDGIFWADKSLYVQIRGRSKTWLFRYQIRGRSRWMGLGPVDLVPASAARRRVLELRLQLLAGVDPLGDSPKRQIVTFAECADAYIQLNRPSWKSDKHAEQWESSLRNYAAPVLGRRPIADISPADVASVVLPIWADKRVTAERVLGRIARVLQWATANGMRDGPNPAAMSTMQHLLPAGRVRGEHHPALPVDALPDFVRELRQRRGESARALEFTILTAARTGETIGATWPEIDLASRVWDIPPERMKAGLRHRVPLSPGALAILSVRKNTAFVFPSKDFARGLSSMAMLQLLRHMAGQGVYTVHGFRSVFRTWGADLTSYPREVLEACLAHVVGSESEKAYQRSDYLDKRVSVMDDWCAFALSACPKEF